MPYMMKCAICFLICVAPATAAVVGLRLTANADATLVITAFSQNKSDLRPETIVLRQKGTTIRWTATGIYYVEKYGKASKYESRVHEGRIDVQGIDLARTFDAVKSKETHGIGPIHRNGTLPYSITLVTQRRVGVCPDLNSAQYVEFAKKSSPLRNVLDDILHAHIYYKSNDMLDLVRDPEGAVADKLMPQYLSFDE